MLDDCDRATSLTTQSPALVWWVEVFGVRKDDRVRMQLVGPDQQILAATTATVAKDRARELRYVGKPRPPEGWRPGRYRVELTLVRADGVAVLGETRTIELR